MFKPFITHKRSSLSLVCAGLAALGLGVAGPVLADASTDFQQPILIDADDQELDMEVNRVIVRNNVVISQGSLRILADRLEVITEEAPGVGEGQIFVASGEPATYQQEVEPGMVVEASAREIRYDTRARVLTLQGEAQMLQSGNQLNASRITYYVDDQRVTAERDEDSEERVRTIFQPRQNENNG